MPVRILNHNDWWQRRRLRRHEYPSDFNMFRGLQLLDNTHSCFCIYTAQDEDACNTRRTYHATRQVFVDPLIGCSTPINFSFSKIEKSVTATSRRTSGPRKQVCEISNHCCYQGIINVVVSQCWVGCIYPTGQTFAWDSVCIGYPWHLGMNSESWPHNWSRILKFFNGINVFATAIFDIIA